MAYDPRGRLVSYGAGGVVTQMGYAGANLSLERSSAGTVLRRYVFGPGSDNPVVWYEGSGTADRRWLQGDERGSVVAISDASGAMLAINRYDEYGIPQPGNLGRFQYTGQTWYPELGLYNYKARWYSPSLGRFMQTDPIGYKDQINLYAYVGNDPVNKADPSGLAECKGTESLTSDCTITVTGKKGKDMPVPVGFMSIVMGDAPRRPQIGQPQRTQPETFAACAIKAAKKNVGVLALDAVSVGAAFVPGGKGVVTAAAAAAGSSTGVAALGIGVVNRDVPGAAIGAAGHYASIAAYGLEDAKGLASNLPVLGQAIAIGGFLYDGYNVLSEGGCLGKGGK